jgi:hypothetical protein
MFKCHTTANVHVSNCFVRAILCAQRRTINTRASQIVRGVPLSLPSETDSSDSESEAALSALAGLAGSGSVLCGTARISVPPLLHGAPAIAHLEATELSVQAEVHFEPRHTLLGRRCRRPAARRRVSAHHCQLASTASAPCAACTAAGGRAPFCGAHRSEGSRPSLAAQSVRSSRGGWRSLCRRRLHRGAALTYTRCIQWCDLLGTYPHTSRRLIHLPSGGERGHTAVALLDAAEVVLRRRWRVSPRVRPPTPHVRARVAP